LSRFSEELQNKLKQAEVKTANNKGSHVYFALNYGGRQEILSAVKKIISENPNQEDITEEYFAKHLQTEAMPDPDIIIRTSGEQRLSGFLPWQGVYSELFFTKTHWPDFSEEEMRTYLSNIKIDFRSQLVLHSHHQLAEDFGINSIHFTEKTRKETTEEEFLVQCNK
jgi:undecaprenyl diphosphate synthase